MSNHIELVFPYDMDLPSTYHLDLLLKCCYKVISLFAQSVLRVHVRIKIYIYSMTHDDNYPIDRFSDDVGIDQLLL